MLISTLLQVASEQANGDFLPDNALWRSLVLAGPELDKT